MAYKNKKKRSGKSKSTLSLPKKIIILCLFVIVCFFAYLSYYQLSNKEDKKIHISTKVITEDKKIKKQEHNNSKILSQKSRKIHQEYKFNKDENLSKIFIKPKNEVENQKSISEITKYKNQIHLDNFENNNTIIQKSNQPSQINIEHSIFASNNKQNKIPENNNTQKSIVQNSKYDKLINNNHKPKLVIIIDDVSTLVHAALIRSVGMSITPSFFPPTLAYKNTPSIAKGFSDYMIHLPLEAMNFKKEEPGTLSINDSYEKILKTIKLIRKNFPNARVINNHTGSKFTSDESAVNRLLKALIKNDFLFLDSRTTSNTKVKLVSEKMGLRYVGRDIFLDDKDDQSVITHQLREAVKTAKKQGYAIAIGHPRKNTISVLKTQKKWLLKEVDVVYLKEIYR